MYENSARSNQWDSWDLWQLVSYAGTAASLLGLIAKPKLAADLGKAATIFGVAGAVHAILRPPRCRWCGSRMGRPQPLYEGGPQWVCECGSALYSTS